LPERETTTTVVVMVMVTIMVTVTLMGPTTVHPRKKALEKDTDTAIATVNKMGVTTTITHHLATTSREFLTTHRSQRR
jgi:hypothetical protein